MSVLFMMCSAVVFSTFAHPLVKIFTTDDTLLKIAVPVMYILSIFQILDGLQISLAGIFKGIRQTEVILLANFLAYWCVSIPLGYMLAFHFGLQLKGFWIGLVTAAALLCSVMIFKIRKFIASKN